MKYKLGEICNFQSGGTPSRNNAEYYNGNIPWITTTALNGSHIDNEKAVDWITEKAIKESAAKIVPANSIMVGTRVGVGKVAINTVIMATSQDIVSLLNIDESVWCKDYLCKFIEGKGAYLNSQARGATIKGIKIETLAGLEIQGIDLAEQQKISMTIDKIRELINTRHQQLEKLDLLVKSRFIEMFGDPIYNSLNLQAKPMTDLCEIIDGDRGKNYPKEFTDEGYCLFLNAKNVTKNGFSFNEKMFITKERDELLRKGKLQYGDIVLTTRGTIGNIAHYTNNIPYIHVRINSGMVILRIDKTVLNEVFFIRQFRMLIDEIIRKVVSGSAQPQLPISTMNKISIVLPPLELQNKFASFVQQVDKSKFVIKQSIEKLELLKSKLMQDYFG